MNKVLLIGRPTRDPYISITQSNLKTARLTIAISRPMQKEQADFVPSIAWNRTAEFIEKYVKKGMLLSIEGRFNSSTYTKDNQIINNYDVHIEKIEILESKSVFEERNKMSNTQEIFLNKNNNSLDNNFNKNNQENENDLNDDQQPWDL